MVNIVTWSGSGLSLPTIQRGRCPEGGVLERRAVETAWAVKQVPFESVSGAL